MTTKTIDPQVIIAAEIAGQVRLTPGIYVARAEDLADNIDACAVGTLGMVENLLLWRPSIIGGKPTGIDESALFLSLNKAGYSYSYLAGMDDAFEGIDPVAYVEPDEPDSDTPTRTSRGAWRRYVDHLELSASPVTEAFDRAEYDAGRLVGDEIARHRDEVCARREASVVAEWQAEHDHAPVLTAVLTPA